MSISSEESTRRPAGEPAGSSGYKVVSIARFAHGVDRAVARQHWAEAHDVLARAAPGLEGCTRSVVLGALPSAADVAKVYSPGTESLFDGYSCFWFADRQAFESVAATPEWRALRAGGSGSFAAPGGHNFHVAAQAATDAPEGGMDAAVEEVWIVDGEPGPYKVVWVVRFKPELLKREAHRYWALVHGPIVADAGIDRYVQSHVVGPLYPSGDGGEPRFDGFSECWFADEQGFVDALATPQWRRLHEDRHQIFAMDQMWSAVLEEHVVISPSEKATPSKKRE
jgi:EthD domain